MFAHHEPLLLFGTTVAAGGSGVLAYLGVRWAAVRGAFRRKGPSTGSAR
jgi:hypothetical protein